MAGKPNLFPHIKVEVLQPGGEWRFAGFLIAAEQPQIQGFIYWDDYEGIPLDPINLDYARNGRRFRGGGTLGDGSLPNILHTHLPGVFAQKIIRRMNPELLRAPEIKQLFAFGSVTRGALRLTIKGGFPEPLQFRGWQELQSARKAAVDAYLGRLREIPEAMVRAFSAGESGARPKANVKLSDGTEWVAKFNAPGDGFNVSRIEHLVHRITQRAGLEGVHSKIIVMAGDEILLMRRYDRDRDGKPIYRVPMSALIGRENNNPVDYGTLDYLDYRDALLKIAPGEIKKLYQMMILHAALNDTDNHSGNIEILASQEGAWRLAPSFDVIPDPGHAVSATSMCRHTIRPRTVEEWGRFITDTAEQFGVSPRLASPILRAVSDARNIAAEDHKFAPSKADLDPILEHLRLGDLAECAARIETRTDPILDMGAASFSPV